MGQVILHLMRQTRLPHFYASGPEGPGGIMFSGCPSVRMYIPPSVRLDFLFNAISPKGVNEFSLNLVGTSWMIKQRTD